MVITNKSCELAPDSIMLSMVALVHCTFDEVLSQSRNRQSLRSAMRTYNPFPACRKYAARGSLSTSTVISSTLGKGCISTACGLSLLSNGASMISLPLHSLYNSGRSCTDRNVSTAFVESLLLALPCAQTCHMQRRNVERDPDYMQRAMAAPYQQGRDSPSQWVGHTRNLSFWIRV